MGAWRIYKAYSPYPSVKLSELDFAQTADVIYFAHLDYPVERLTRSGHTDWTFAEVEFGPVIEPPATPTGSANSPNNTGYVATDYNYVITAIGGDREQESRASGILTLSNDLTLAGNTNVIDLPSTVGVDRHIVYKEQGGSYGYIGGSDGTSFTDNNLQPVLSDTPPTGDNPFDDAGDYPSTVAFHQQRLLFGRTRNRPNAVWGSQPSDFENMDKSRPTKPDDALSFALVAERVNSVNQLVSLGDLLALTSDGVFSIDGGSSGEAISPNAINPKRQTGRGASRLNPIVLDSIVFYRPNKGSTVRTLGYTFEVDGYRSNNVSIFSPHFFEGFSIVRWTFIEDPFSCIVAVRDDGALLFFTWEEEQAVWGWTLCETNGVVEDVAAISEGGYDRLYIAVRRTINGVTRRFFERMALPHVDDITTACHLDCALTQVYGTPQNRVEQLWHLEGETVSAYYDGYVAEGLVVEGGAIELPDGYEASIATVGLPYEGYIETLPLVLQGRGGTLHSHMQNIKSVMVRTIDARGITIGITGAAAEEVRDRTGSEVGGLADVSERDYEPPIPGHWEKSATLTIKQSKPLPAHITAVFVEPKVSPK